LDGHWCLDFPSEENAFAKMDELHDMGQSDEDYVKDYMKDKLDMEY
jgi:hypothetical protein|tara:strand:+ start:901 stop:1038 length:138 start_codon:yes stop_codon:yes gene_type:complete